MRFNLCSQFTVQIAAKEPYGGGRGVSSSFAACCLLRLSLRKRVCCLASVIGRYIKTHHLESRNLSFRRSTHIDTRAGAPLAWYKYMHVHVHVHVWAFVRGSRAVCELKWSQFASPRFPPRVFSGAPRESGQSRFHGRMLQAVDYRRAVHLLTHHTSGGPTATSRSGNASSAYAPSIRAQLGPSVVRCVQGGSAQEAGATRAGLLAACVEEALHQAVLRFLP